MRDLIYGYEIKDGLLRVKKSEAKYVRFMFDEYLKGKSLCNIANWLNKNNAPVHKQGGKWSHGMISRIIKNLRYSGDMGYPNIITKSQQQEAIHMLENRDCNMSRKKAGSRNKDSPFYKMGKCSKCGSNIRVYDYKGTLYLKCSNEKDKGCLLESELRELTLYMINELIENNDLIECVDNKELNILEITKIENQINEMLKNHEASCNEINRLMKVKHQVVYEQYKNDSIAESMQLKARLSMMKKQEELTHELLRQIVRKIIFHEEGNITFVLLNNQRIEKPITFRERRMLCQE